MKKELKIGVIGFGNMGQSLAKTLAGESLYQVKVYDADKRKIKNIKKFQIAKNTKELIEDAAVIILAIKPQDVVNFLKSNKDCLTQSKKLLITIAAGLPTKLYEDQIECLRVVRVMPNLAAKVGEAVSFICGGGFATKKDLAIAERIFSCIGEGAVVEENFIDKATSISGSGPGYVFYFMDIIYNQALKLGFDKEYAKKTIIQTFLGAVKLAKSSDKSFKDLVKGVASRGGTTEAALKVFKEKKIDKNISQGIIDAYRRAMELSGKKKKKK